MGRFRNPIADWLQEIQRRGTRAGGAPHKDARVSGVHQSRCEQSLDFLDFLTLSEFPQFLLCHLVLLPIQIRPRAILQRPRAGPNPRADCRT